MNPYLALLKAFWWVIPMVGLFVYGTYWHHEAKDIAKDYAVFKSDTIAAGERFRANQLQEKITRDKITQDEEKKHAAEDATRDTRYDVALARVRQLEKGGPGSGQAKPVSGTATICADPAADKRLSDAVSIHLAEVRRILAAERTETMGQLRVAEKQTGTLIVGQEWLTRQRAVVTP